MNLGTELEGIVRQMVENQTRHALEYAGMVSGKPAGSADYIRLQTKESGPWPWDEHTGSGPNAWQPRSPAVALFVSAAAIKEIASKLPEGQIRRDLVSAADQSLAEWEDDYCGTHPPHPLAAFALASELAVFANSLQEGTLRTSILQEAGQIAQKGFGGTVTPKAMAAAAGKGRG